MKSRNLILLALLVAFVASLSSPVAANADFETMGWTTSGKIEAQAGGGDDDPPVGDVEGDPENWLGGQNMRIDSPTIDPTGPDVGSLAYWFMQLLNVLSFGLIR